MLDGLSTSVAVKAPVIAVASGNVTLAGLQTIGSRVLEEDDRVLLTAQTDATENGIWSATTGDWTRTRDFDGNRDVVNGTLIPYVVDSTVGALYQVTSDDDPIIIGTSELTIELRENPEGPTLQLAADLRAKPTGFSFVPGNVLECTGPGEAIHDFDAEQEFLNLYSAVTGSSEYYVDYTNGNDANSGSINAPFKTIRGCFQNAAGLGICWLLPGVHDTPFDVRATDNTVSGGTAGRAVRIKAWGGPGSVIFRDPGAQPGDMAWTLNGGATFTYTATPSGSPDAWLVIFHEDDREVHLPYKTSAANVEASVSGWYQDPGTKAVYIRHQNRTISDPGQAGRFEIIYGSASSSLVYGARVYLEGIIFRGGNQLTIQPDGTFFPVCFARYCKWQYRAYHNVQTQGAYTLFQDCVSEYSLGGDGYNYNKSGSTESQVIEIDCIGRFNGVTQYSQFDGDRNKQGSSGHDSSVILRVNGQYYGNYGQNIADTGTGSKTWMVGSEIGNPYADLAPGGIGRYYALWTEGTAYLDCVRAGGRASSYGLWVESGTAYQYRCNFSGVTANTGANTGTSVIYDPMA